MHATEDISTRIRTSGLLYPMMVIAAIAVTVFSIVGIATMMGWMPEALSGHQPVAKSGVAESRLPGGITRPAMDDPRDARTLPTAAVSRAATCRDCGVIEAIRTVKVPGESSWMGAGGGAAVGALLGSQIGHGRGQMLASGVGAGAGSYAGIQVEKHLKKSVKYQVRVRMEDGKLRTFTRTNKPALAVGQKVRVTDRGIVAAG
jgi:outer membrane lipoprotein SlyB